MVNQFALVFFSLVARQNLTINKIGVEVTSTFSTISLDGWVVDWFYKLTIIDHQFGKAYKASIVISGKEDTEIVGFDWTCEFSFDVAISWHLRIMGPAICQGIISCFIGKAISNADNIGPSLAIWTDLDLTISKIVLSSVLDVGSNFLDIPLATKLQGNMATFMGII